MCKIEDLKMIDLAEATSNRFTCRSFNFIKLINLQMIKSSNFQITC
jgi:hypothetical protein